MFNSKVCSCVISCWFFDNYFLFWISENFPFYFRYLHFLFLHCFPTLLSAFACFADVGGLSWAPKCCFTNMMFFFFFSSAFCLLNMLPKREKIFFFGFFSVIYLLLPTIHCCSQFYQCVCILHTLIHIYYIKYVCRMYGINYYLVYTIQTMFLPNE